MDNGVRAVTRHHQFMKFTVFLGVCLGILNHALDFVVRQTGARLDLDFLFLAGRLVSRADMHDAVGVDIESDLDLGHAARRGADAGQVETGQ